MQRAIFFWGISKLIGDRPRFSGDTASAGLPSHPCRRQGQGTGRRPHSRPPLLFRSCHFPEVCPKLHGISAGLRLYEQLSEAPDEKTRARLIAEAFDELEARFPPLADLATRGHVRESELSLQREIKEVEGRLQKEIREVEGRLQKEIREAN